MKSLALGRIRAAAKKVESDGIQPSVGMDLSKLKDMWRFEVFPMEDLRLSGAITQRTWDKWMTKSIEYGIVLMGKSSDYVWSYVKYDRLANYRAQNLAELRQRVTEELNSVAEQPNLLRALFFRRGLALDD